MVKKLFKQELISYIRSLLPMELVLLGIAALTRIIQFFEVDSISYEIISVSSIVALVVSMVVCLVMTEVIAIKRYYSNLFTNEGYLTLTLPVANSAHIITKLVCAVCVNIISFLNVILAVCIATAGEVCKEIFKAGFYLLEKFIEYTKVDGVFYIIEIIILFIVTLAVQMLLFYTCITLGQMAKKNRVLAAFGVYFGYYFICQTLGTVMTVFATAFYDILPLEQIALFAERNPYEFVHIILCLSIILSLVMGLIYYAISIRVINRKLNLE